ncbi:MAG: demethoxyubiquinone hydroxylase family protein [Novosphingobium sp.]|nr:demethoxyubiquinone hydroxylase family protein [Novosphingobium sp.]
MGVLGARLKPGESIGDRVIKVDHAGEHGAIAIYRAQRWVSRWRSPSLVPEIERFLAHELHHRSLFGAELQRRGRSRCRSYHLCGLGGLVLGFVTALAGPQAVSATTVAVERVVLRHLAEQSSALRAVDPSAALVVDSIIADERDHHDSAKFALHQNSVWSRLIEPIVAASTETVIWLGMKL